MIRRAILTAAALFALGGAAVAQTVTREPITREQLAEGVRGGKCVTLQASVDVCGADYEFDGNAIEALLFRPASKEAAPVVLLIPGYERTALDWVRTGTRLARAGYLSMAVTQPGFGGSKGVRDYVGPATIRVLSDAIDRLKRVPGADPNRVAVYGHSRGGMAASLLAVRRGDLRAAVLSAGLYDFSLAFCEATIAGIRDNMARETGMTMEAIAERSAVFQADKLRAPVLILHGEKDINVPVSQAKTMRARLEALGKPFEAHIYPDLDHSLNDPKVADTVLAFLDRHVK